VLGGVAVSLLALAKAPFTMIAAVLCGIGVAMLALVANPVGLIIGGLVAGLAALGMWVANNWEGVKTFFSAFGSSFMEDLGGANGPLGTMVGHLQSAYNWLSQLLGPLDMKALVMSSRCWPIKKPAGEGDQRRVWVDGGTGGEARPHR
jgi:hypothetical protein